MGSLSIRIEVDTIFGAKVIEDSWFDLIGIALDGDFNPAETGEGWPAYRLRSTT